MLKPNTACREVVRQVQALFRLAGRGGVDEGDSAYVQARQRLPKARLEKALAATAQAADRRASAGGQLNGRPVKVVDCSTTQLPDTQANQQRYPQAGGQKPGCGFPVLKFLVLFSLASGAVLHVVMTGWRNHDLRLFRQAWDQLMAGDIGLGDRAFGDYVTLASLPQRGVDLVARLHQRRQVDFRQAQRLAKNDGLFVWTKGGQPSHVLSAREWRQLSAQITVRVLRFTATIPRTPRPPDHAGHHPAGSQTLPGPGTDRPLLPPVASGIMFARPQNNHGPGTVALPVPGPGREGIAGRPGRAQSGAVPHGGSGSPLRRRGPTGKF